MFRLISRTKVIIRPAITSDGSNIQTSRYNRQIKCQTQVSNLKSIEIKIKLKSKPHTNLKSIQTNQFQIQIQSKSKSKSNSNSNSKTDPTQIQPNSNPSLKLSNSQIISFPTRKFPDSQISKASATHALRIPGS